MSTSDLEKELAAVKAERAAREEAREAANREKALAAELAKQKRGIVEDEKFAELLEEYGIGSIGRINTPHGMVVVKAPAPIVYRRLVDELALSEHANPRIRKSAHDSLEKAVRQCRVYPDPAKFDELAEKVPTLVVVATNMAVDLGRAEAAEEQGK